MMASAIVSTRTKSQIFLISTILCTVTVKEAYFNLGRPLVYSRHPWPVMCIQYSVKFSRSSFFVIGHF